MGKRVYTVFEDYQSPFHPKIVNTVLRLPDGPLVTIL